MPADRRGIDAATWRRLSPLLDQALDLPPPQREPWLNSLNDADADLEQPLRELLARAANDATPDPRLDTLPKLDLDAGLDDGEPGSHRAGERVGPYRLQRLLGEGGMGVVWLAQRADGAMQRSVALKLPHGPFRGDLAARIARERDILASLDHPHIARLYDAGIATDGQPYLALEAVDGQRIDHYAEAHQLGVAARLRLFVQAARAVAHAHARLVVHRDLKPSNLLVDAQGQVKLLDFGIAKLLDDGPHAAPELTRQGARAMTPDYAAPEQISGLAVDTRCDVYSLGVLLFKLLTGERPYRLQRDSRAALEEAILAADVPRPSDVVTDPKRRQALRGDIDTIVQKALKKSPADRYPSVEALADDIERHLAQRPVLAQPDRFWYRTSRFIVRNRIGVATAALLLATLLGGAGAALWQARIAVAERQRAEDVKDFVAAIFREASPYDGSGKKELSALDLLKQADRRLEATLAGQPGARVELSNMIGESLIALGDASAAEPVIERAVTESERALGATHLQTLRALMLRSQVHRLRGRAEPARVDLDRALPVLRERADTDPADLATALAHRTLTAIDLGAYADAERFAVEGAELTQARLGEANPATVASAVLLSLAYRFTKKFELARDSGERGQRLALAVHGAAPPHPRVIEARSVYARALADSGDLVRGVAMLEAAIVDARALLGPGNLQAGILVQNVVDYQLDLGELDRAEANANDALSIISANLAADSLPHALTVHTRALAHLDRRNTAAARSEAARAVAVLDTLVGGRHEASLTARTTLALAVMQQGHFAEAAAAIDAVANDSAALAPASALRARLTLARGTIARLRGEPGTALGLLQPLADSTEPAPKWQRERMRALSQIGMAQLDLNQPEPAVQSFERALTAFDRLETRVTPVRADALLGLGQALLALGDAARALPALERANEFWRGFDPSSRSASVAADWLSRARVKAAQRD